MKDVDMLDDLLTALAGDGIVVRSLSRSKHGKRDSSKGPGVRIDRKLRRIARRAHRRIAGGI